MKLQDLILDLLKLQTLHGGDTEVVVGLTTTINQNNNFVKIEGFATDLVSSKFVDSDELNKVVDYLKSQGAPDYNEEILTGASDIAIPGFEDDSNADSNSIEKDSVFDQAVKFIIDSKRCSISSLQTQFGIGYNKAARIMNHLEKIGMVRRTDRGGFELLNNVVL